MGRETARTDETAGGTPRLVPSWITIRPMASRSHASPVLQRRAASTAASLTDASPASAARFPSGSSAPPKLPGGALVQEAGSIFSILQRRGRVQRLLLCVIRFRKTKKEYL